MMFKWLFLLTQALEVLSLVFMGLIIKRAEKILKIWLPHFTWRQKEVDCVTENISFFFFFNWLQTFTITRHCTLDLWHQTTIFSIFHNMKWICWLLILCQQFLEGKEFVCIVHLYEIYVNWNSQNSAICPLDSQNWEPSALKRVIANQPRVLRQDSRLPVSIGSCTRFWKY